MRGEQTARLDLVVEKLSDTPCDREPVEGRRAATDLVENNQRAIAGVVDNVGRFIHLHHERRLSPAKIIARADPGENAIDQSELCAFRRDETPNVSHQYN